MKKSGVKNTLKLIKNIILWILIGALALLMIVIMTAKINGGTPSVFGYSVYRIISGSMEPELMTGDVILSKEVDDKTQIQVDDVVTFEGENQYKGMKVTHKVIVAPHTNADGQLVLQTKGVANEIADDEISADSVISVMVCKIAVFDSIYNFFLSPWGLLVFILLLIAIFFDEIINLVKAASGHSDDKEEDIGEIIERIQREEQERLSSESADNNK